VDVAVTVIVQVGAWKGEIALVVPPLLPSMLVSYSGGVSLVAQHRALMKGPPELSYAQARRQLSQRLSVSGKELTKLLADEYERELQEKAKPQASTSAQDSAAAGSADTHAAEPSPAPIRTAVRGPPRPSNPNTQPADD
jgi:hypothetical protein